MFDEGSEGESASFKSEFWEEGENKGGFRGGEKGKAML